MNPVKDLIFLIIKPTFLRAPSITAARLTLISCLSLSIVLMEVGNSVNLSLSISLFGAGIAIRLGLFGKEHE